MATRPVRVWVEVEMRVAINEGKQCEGRRVAVYRGGVHRGTPGWVQPCAALFRFQLGRFDHFSRGGHIVADRRRELLRIMQPGRDAGFGHEFLHAR